MIGFNKGRTMQKNLLNIPHPSIVAASSNSSGIFLINPWNRIIAIEHPNPWYIKIKPGVFNKWSCPIFRISGSITHWNGISIAEAKIIKITLLALVLYLTSAQAASEEIKMIITTVSPVIFREFVNELKKFRGSSYHPLVVDVCCDLVENRGFRF